MSARGLTPFFESAEERLAELGPRPEAFREIGELLGEIPVDFDAATLAALHYSPAGFTILGHGPKGSTLMLARFPSEAPTPVHNHNSCGVLRVIRGRDRHVLWGRDDDGSIPGQARLHVIETRELASGDVAWFLGPPRDIHSQQGIGGEAWELVYFERDPTETVRLYFDPERKLVREGAPP